MNTTGLIVDVVVSVFVLLLVIFGTWRGMYKLIFGLVSGLLSIVLAVVLMGTVTNFIVSKTELETQLNGAINEKVLDMLPAELEADRVRVVIGEETTTVVNDETGEEYESVSAYVSEKGGSLSAIASVLDKLTANETVRASFATKSEEGEIIMESPTLADMLCIAVTTYLLLVIVYFVLWIFLFVLIRVLMIFVKKIVTHTYVGHFLDKVLGFALGLSVAMVIIWGGLAVIRLLGTYTWIISVNNVINGSTLTKWLFENNFLYTFLVDTMNLQDTISGIIGSFSGFTGGGAAAAE